jgi:hypothetical protein
MGRTERRFLVAATIAWLIALSAPAGAAALDAADGTAGPASSLSGSPTAFAERVVGPQGRYAGGHGTGALQNAIELIVLVATCAIGVAFYSSTSARSEGARVPVRSSRR